MKPEDYQIIEQIVAGDLSGRERQQHLLRFRAESSHCWEPLALCFLEKQILAETFAEDPIAPPQVTLPRYALQGALVAAALAIGALLGTGFSSNRSSDSTLTTAAPTPPSAEVVDADKVITPEHHSYYVSTQLENGNQLVLPISYLDNSR